ncbi:DUF1800 domain-containing protein [Kaarinaea lacus]
MSNFQLLKHLHNRIGFGATATDIQPYLDVPYEIVIEQLLSSASTATIIPPPDWVNELPPSKKLRKQLSREDKKAFRKKIRARHIQLKTWWLNEIVETPNPLVERMTLFWHNHFTSSLKKVKWPNFMYQQNMLFRGHCMGNFGRLLHAVSRDPAMLIYLDNVSNNKDKPNENFARELLELFTLGEGNYTEQDVREAARSFTGWKVRRQTAEYRFARKKHDFGSKTFLGKTGNLNGDDIINLLLEHPRTATTIAAKLWKEFVSLTPNDAMIDQLADVFRSNDYEIKPVLKAIFLSPEFMNSGNYGTLIKSPLELTVGTIRQLQIHVHDLAPVARYNRRLGQDIMDPQTVKGWPGGKRWISADTLLARQAFLQKISRGQDMHHMQKRRMKKDNMKMDIRMSDSFLLELTANQLNSHMLEKVLLPLKKINPVSSNDLYQYTMQLLLDPVYQLK